MILLDTHVLVWASLSRRKLSRAAESAIRRAGAQGVLAISAISLLELARLIAADRIERRGTVRETIDSLTAGVLVIPITAEIAALTAYLPADFPSDQADRAIAATAQAEGVALVTADVRIQACPLVKTVW
ncbi:MAG: type II toxin-antitoxin system VapC family toxin [Candidatus Korobacteraceae bacterium]